MNKKRVGRVCLILSLILFLTAAGGVAGTTAKAFASMSEGVGIIGGAGAPTAALLIRDALLGPWGYVVLASLGLLALSLILSPEDGRDSAARKGRKNKKNDGSNAHTDGAPDDPAPEKMPDNDADAAPGTPDGKRRYPFSLFLVGTFVNLITRNLLLTFAALVISVTGIWVPACRPIGAGLAILSLLLSVVEQLIIRWHILHDPPSEEFDEMRDAMLSDDWMKRTKEVLDKRIGQTGDDAGDESPDETEDDAPDAENDAPDDADNDGSDDPTDAPDAEPPDAPQEDNTTDDSGTDDNNPAS